MTCAKMKTKRRNNKEKKKVKHIKKKNQNVCFLSIYSGRKNLNFIRNLFKLNFNIRFEGKFAASAI